MFRHRLEAAESLARRLTHLKGQQPLVLAIPRGGVPMGRYLADCLAGDMDVVLVRKLRAPGNPEYAIGAVGEGEQTWLEKSASQFSEDAITREIEYQRGLLETRRQRYTPVRAPLPPTQRQVIVVDDGSATGATMTLALQCLRRHTPARLIAALGVAPPATLARLEAFADEVVCAECPPHFRAVGQFYDDFSPVNDTDVIQLLNSRPD